MAPDELLPHIQTNQIHHTRKVLNFYQHILKKKLGENIKI